jgi:hypothetical protein
MYSKFVAKMAENQTEMRNRLRTLLISSPLGLRALANEMKISEHTLGNFTRGRDVYPRTAWKIAAFIEKEMQKAEFD